MITLILFKGLIYVGSGFDVLYVRPDPDPFQKGAGSAKLAETVLPKSRILVQKGPDFFQGKKFPICNTFLKGSFRNAFI